MAFIDLFRPALKHSDWKVRKAAVEQCGYEMVLAEIAKTDSNVDVRRAAVERIQVVLANIATNSDDYAERMEVTARLTDQVLAQAVYAAVARNEKLTVVDLRKEAVGKLTDQLVLAWVAKYSNVKEVRAAAFGRLTDQAALADIAMDATDREVRITAIRMLTENNLLKEMARYTTPLGAHGTRDLAIRPRRESDDKDVRRVASERIAELHVAAVTDQAKLSDIAGTHVEPDWAGGHWRLRACSAWWRICGC
jgi:uncharacterized DUF497 family protein